jgi:hypothetical protein
MYSKYQIPSSKFQMTNLFGSLDIVIWNLFVFWCLYFDIFEYPNTQDSISKDDLSIGNRTVKFHTRVEGLKSFL